jgi:hypothetical protein
LFITQRYNTKRFTTKHLKLSTGENIMGLSKGVIGTIATVIIGGGAYTISQTDVVNNFAKETGMTQEQAQQYVNGIDKDSLVSYDQLGNELISDGNEASSDANKIDCVNYTYPWVTTTLSCYEGQSQLNEISTNEVNLGNAYEKLSSSSASKTDISSAIEKIDALNNSYHLEIVGKILDQPTITSIEQTNSYNKATLQAALKDN